MNLDFTITSNFIKHFETTKRIVISQGSARSGKTFSILQLLIIEAIKQPNLIISVVGENVPFLKRGAVADFKNIMYDVDLFQTGIWNKSELTFTFNNGSKIEFFSVENPARALGAARDFLFINECNSIKYETAFQLLSRTKQRVFLDFNPKAEFWVNTEIMNATEFDGMYDFVKTTFAGNEMFSEEQKLAMIARGKRDANYKRIYIDGEMGINDDTIFTNFTTENVDIEKLIEENDIRKQWFGVDFGWSNDPTSINEIYIVGDKLYINELHYAPKTTNRQIYDIIRANKRLQNYEVIADSSEPKSIAEIFRYGMNIKGALKPPGSILYGIELLKNYDIILTNQSLNVTKEFRNYGWATNRLGEPLYNSKGKPVPVDNWNHAIDNIRYVVYQNNENKIKPITFIPRRNSGMRAV